MDSVNCYDPDAMEEYKVKEGLTDEEVQYLNLLADGAEVEHAGEISTLSLSW